MFDWESVKTNQGPRGGGSSKSLAGNIHTSTDWQELGRDITARIGRLRAKFGGALGIQQAGKAGTLVACPGIGPGCTHHYVTALRVETRDELGFTKIDQSHPKYDADHGAHPLTIRRIV